MAVAQRMERDVTAGKADALRICGQVSGKTVPWQAETCRGVLRGLCGEKGGCGHLSGGRAGRAPAVFQSPFSTSPSAKSPPSPSWARAAGEFVASAASWGRDEVQGPELCVSCCCFGDGCSLHRPVFPPHGF